MVTKENEMEFIELIIKCKSINQILNVCEMFDFDIYGEIYEFITSDDYEEYIKNLAESGELFSLKNVLNSTKNLGAKWYLADLSLGSIGYPYGYNNNEPEDIIVAILDHFGLDLEKMMDKFGVHQIG